VAEVKADMEQPRPMDRLICGDVGYGKTEVAVRAAFKAVMDGKQVAVLVPTTVLAQQHLLTFQQRLGAFPVRVTMLSRFCSPQEEREAVEGLREGRMDIVVGTHRLLQKDVVFKNLGLLIVDEEQRFGVRHKEWLKQMRQQVDVLTLTATPIPRTLYMALSDVRDMSTIDTPPEERLPIRTQVAEYDEGLIRRAVLRELNRGGQVYFVHNRVQDIDLVHEDLRVMAWLAPLLVGRIPVTALANPPALVEVFAHTINEELDFRLEAENMLEVARSFAELGQRGYVIPRPHPTLVTRRMLVMERLSGFVFDDVAGIRNAGIDTHAIIRTGMIGFLEGALINGIFHGDLHGGNLFVRPDGRTALLDFGITGRLSEPRRLAFLRLLIAGTMNDANGQLAAMRDLGALPHDVDLAAVSRDLGFDAPPIDPTQLTADELVAELQRVTKALIGYGARIPKELLLFVKNLVFLDGAIATLAPDLDLFAEIQQLALYFATTHGERIAEQVGMDPSGYQIDMTAVKGSFGVDAGVESFTHRELLERRELIKKRLSSRRR